MQFHFKHRIILTIYTSGHKALPISWFTVVYHSTVSHTGKQCIFEINIYDWIKKAGLLLPPRGHRFERWHYCLQKEFP